MELDMTQGSPGKLILRFTTPIIIGNIFQQLYNMVDSIIVGRYVGNKALAAVGATGTIMFLILGFMQGLTAGFTVLTSQRFGAGDEQGLKRSVGNAALLSVSITALMTVFSLIGMKGLLRLMQTPEDIFDMSYTYIWIICLGMWANILYNLLASFLRAVGNSKVPLYFLIISAILNVILDLILILVFQMGVAGAAWATVIAQGVSGILCLIYIAWKVPILHLRRQEWRLNGSDTKNQIRIGVPMALQFSITAIGTIIIQAALNTLGSTAVAAYTAAVKLEQLTTQPFSSMGQAMATYCGQNMGKRDLKRMKKGVHVAELFTVVYAIVGAIFIIHMVPLGVRLFVSEDIEIITSYVDLYMKICGTFFIPLGLIFVYRNAMQGAGFGFMPMMGGVVELAARSVAALIAVYLKSFTGICLGNVAAWVTAAVFLAIAYWRLIGRKKEILVKMEKRSERSIKK